MKDIATRELKTLIGKEGIAIIDVRPVDAYNGWAMKNEERGGHIRGARSLPFKWTNYMDWIEIVRSKDIKPDDVIIIYGYLMQELEKVAELFEKASYKAVRIYSRFVEEWTTDPDLPMEHLKRFKHLVSPHWLNELIHSEKKNFVICHAHYRNRNDYEIGHIPGAIALDTLDLESPVTWNRRSPKELKNTLQNLGITKDTTVVLYGRFSFPDNNDPFPGSNAGHLGAIRCAAIMLYAGVEDVKVLNGGIQSWEDEGFKLSTEETEFSSVKDFGTIIPREPQLMIDTPRAKELIESDKGDIVSVRSWSEWIGEVSGYNYIEKKGRIPGAVFGNCGTDAYHMENYRNLDHTTREYHEIAKIWKDAKITPDKHLAFYCGTGWRGSEAFFNAWLMGWPHASVYDGGWFEWSNDPENPTENGVPLN